MQWFLIIKQPGSDPKVKGDLTPKVTLWWPQIYFKSQKADGKENAGQIKYISSGSEVCG